MVVLWVGGVKSRAKGGAALLFLPPAGEMDLVGASPDQVEICVAIC